MFESALANLSGKRKKIQNVEGKVVEINTQAGKFMYDAVKYGKVEMYRAVRSMYGPSCG